MRCVSTTSCPFCLTSDSWPTVCLRHFMHEEGRAASSWLEKVILLQANPYCQWSPKVQRAPTGRQGSHRDTHAAVCSRTASPPDAMGPWRDPTQNVHRVTSACWASFPSHITSSVIHFSHIRNELSREKCYCKLIIDAKRLWKQNTRTGIIFKRRNQRKGYCYYMGLSGKIFPLLKLKLVAIASENSLGFPNSNSYFHALDVTFYQK